MNALTTSGRRSRVEHLEPDHLILLRQVWQGRITREAHTRRSGTYWAFHRDDQACRDGDDIRFEWLLKNGYVEHAPVQVGEEWVRVNLSEFGQETMEGHGAGQDQFADWSLSQIRAASEATTAGSDL